MHRAKSFLRKRITSINGILDYIEAKSSVVNEIKMFFGNELMSKSTSILSDENVKKVRAFMIDILKDERKKFEERL